MRLTGFIAGGILGAAAVMYLSRQQNRTALFTSMNTAGDSIGRMMKTVKDKSVETVLNQKFGRSAGAHTDNSSHQIRNIINSDPKLKSEFDAVMQDNKENAQQMQ